MASSRLRARVPQNEGRTFLSPGNGKSLGAWLLIFGLCFAAATVLAAGEDAFYKLGPDSLPQEGVPKGKLKGPFVIQSNVFPGTQHTYWIYVPAQYDPHQAAALMIFNDGQAMINMEGDVRVPNVIDNLTWRREIPVMLTVFINPGRTPEQPEPNPRDWGDRNTNRPEEYNRLNDKYARVIIEELMPELFKQYNISKDPNMRALAGASSGAIAAFTVAWERPDYFRKVISIVGSFVNLRGGDVYPEKILATEPKPIRIFLVDGVNDNRALRGDQYDPTRDWHYQNVRLVEALTKKGYDVNYTWGIGLHGQKQGGAVLPEMMRWLWRDYPRSYDAHDSVERSFRGPLTNPPPAGAASAETPRHIVFIIGENEYHTWETLPDFARQELDTNRFRCTFVTASPKEGDNAFAGFEAIKEADLLFISVRRRTPPNEMMALIRRHLEAGKPLVGIRTASHAFGATPPDKEHEGWNSFDVDVLGCNYQNHYNNGTPSGAQTLVQILEGTAHHPILSGISNQPFPVTSSLYKNRYPGKSVTVLMRGQVEGQDNIEPVSWINTNQDRRVFYTSLGNPGDFRQPFFRRLLVNGITWALEIPAPGSAYRPEENKLRKPVAGTNELATKPAGSLQPAPLPPGESLERFKVSEDLQLDQVLAEPVVRQPVFVNFDERGRMWVVEYLQYPFPAGLKMLSHDSFWRAVYDKVPPPPPHHFVGADKITIHEDTKGNGVFDKHTTFIQGLNIVTSVVRGRGGVWVLNPPYLLFYPDRNNDDIPDGDPEVVLSGFGLEDTHSVVNSLRWGPDGWLYGCQGSTVSASIIRPGLDKEPLVHTMGQQIWRYHPPTKRFEVFSEGGGNAFGCEIDEKGRIFSGHNGGNTRGFHYMQGAYLEKGFDKHGPLSNPYAFGYFPAMSHPPVERFTHNFIIYAGRALPSHYDGRLFGVEPLQGRIVESEIVPVGSSFKTSDLGYPVTTSDTWFRPVDIKLGPDGAIYVADWYDAQVNHYHNHEGRIDKSNGRIYRLKSKDAQSVKPFDLGKLSNEQLLALLGNKNKWFRQEALRVIGDRADHSMIPVLKDMVRTNSGQLALESFWALNLSGGFDEEVALQTLFHTDPFVRLWTARLLGDSEKISTKVSAKLRELASTEENVEVRAQLACTAKRLPAHDALPLVKTLLSRTADAGEARLPLLLWWAIESKCGPNPEAVLALFSDGDVWRFPIVEQFIIERLMRRFTQAGTRNDLAICAELLRRSPGTSQSARLMAGFELAFKGRSQASLPPDLLEALARAGGDSLMVQLRRGDRDAKTEALAVIANPTEPMERRQHYLEILSNLHEQSGLPPFLKLFHDPASQALQPALLAAFQSFDQPEVGEALIEQLPKLTNSTQTAAFSLLASRPQWSLQLLEAMNAGRILCETIPPDAKEKIKAYSEPRLKELVRKYWGSERKATTAEMQQSIEHYASAIRSSEGNPYEGRKLFGMSCALCHKLFGQGAQIGPDLTPYQRGDLDTMLLNIVNPNAEIREGYETYLVSTKDGRTLSGFLADKDNRAIVLRGIDGMNQVVETNQIQSMKPSGLSLMPEGLLTAFNDQQVCDLFAYLRSTQPLVGEPPKPAPLKVR